MPAEGTRCALGTKRVVPSVLDLLKAFHKTHKPVPKAISFAQDATETPWLLAPFSRYVTAMPDGESFMGRRSKSMGPLIRHPPALLPRFASPRRLLVVWWKLYGFALIL